MFKQIGHFMENLLSKFQCGFRKGYSTQQCLIVLTEKLKCVSDKGKSFGALLTDFVASRLVCSYLSNRKQRTKINESFNSWGEALFRVPQGPILEPLLFNIFMCDLFIKLTVLILPTMQMITLLLYLVIHL